MLSTCDTACVDVCPVDCIHGPDDTEDCGLEAKKEGFNPEGKMLYINPDECIDCGAVNLNVLLKLFMKKMQCLMNGPNILK